MMAIEAKRNETRGRRWNYKGDVAICSTLEHWPKAVPQYAEKALERLWEHREKFESFNGNIHDLYDSLPFGKVVCVVEKTGCISTNDDNGDDRSLTPLELDCGDYSADRFYYPTRNCRRLVEPVKVRGGQGIFILPTDVAAKVLAQIR